MAHRTIASVSIAALAAALAWTAPAEAQDAAGLAAAGTTPADAATQEQASDTAINDIVVTAQRREESLSRVGVSVTALGSEQLVRQGIGEPQDLVGLVPGFQATSTYGGATVYTLRGIGFNTRNPSSTAPIGLYLDQAALPYPYMAQGVSFDLERVEVLKGPQGTLYGRNATGGLINYVTGKPTDTLKAGLTFEVGNYRTVNVSGFVAGPLSDSVRARVAFDSQNRGQGWQRSVTRDERLGQMYQQSFRGTLDFGNGGPLTASLTGTYWNRHGDSLAGQAIFYIYGTRPVANPRTAASIIANPTSNTQADWNSIGNQPQADIGIFHPAPLVDSQFSATSLNVGYELSDTVRIASLTSYNELHHRDVSDAAGVQTESIFQDTTGRIRSVSEELRLIGESDRFNWSIGGYFADDRATERDIGYNDQNGQIALLRGLAQILPQTRYTPAQLRRSFGNYDVRGQIDSNVYAGFANAEYKLSDLFKLSVGGRYTQDKQRFAGCVRDYLGGNVALVNTVYPVLTRTGGTYNLAPGQCYTLQSDLRGFVGNAGVQRQQDQSNFSWNVTATVTPTDTTLFYGTVARGFKAGVFPIFAASVETQLDPVREEELTSYEVGTKLGLFDRRIQLNVNAFYYDYQDKQIYGRVTDLIFGTLSRIRNVPKSRVYGVEGDVTWRIVPALTFSAAGAYLNSKITSDFADFTELGVPTNFKGRPFSYTPEWQGSATLAYDAPITDTLRLVASATANAQGKSSADFAGDPLWRIKARTLVNGTIGVASDEGWELTAYGKNIFNEYYWAGVTSAIDTVIRYPGMPAEYGLRASFRF
ncbi:hypothetical protein ASG29_04195 [Sphingomonas sp. Leaf412]|uniref:TonB-dependent receptor n=1 Tax=Sphingomonas sp. Leaf412 TaxID=1736370 RepID=UPI0006FF9D66|nr:TonB-dependent receptor [Sphingomonas sp. Leaf412]KQT35306.1 hypothetical protein ASG29_04195 [Sphingomonas sp. Leaf412]